jgi:hypothetical protein
LIPEAVGKHSIAHGGRVRLLLQPQTLIPPAKTLRQRGVHPLIRVQLRLGDHIVLEDQGRFHHKQFLFTLDWSMIAMRRSPSRITIPNHPFTLSFTPAATLHLLLLLSLRCLLTLEVETGLSLGDDEASPEGIATIQGLIVLLVAAASIFGVRWTEKRDLEAGYAPADVVVYLGIHLLVALEQA